MAQALVAGIPDVRSDRCFRYKHGDEGDEEYEDEEYEEDDEEDEHGDGPSDNGHVAAPLPGGSNGSSGGVFR
jgi:hypothetical protein